MPHQLAAVLPRVDEGEVMEANRAQAAVEAEMTKIGEHRKYSGIVAQQRQGPLERFVIPEDFSRQSRYKLLEMYLADPLASVAADFDDIRIALYGGSDEDPLDLIPLTMHPEMHV